MRPHIREARCGKCGETFNPHGEGEEDLEHWARESGEECGGQGRMVGRYYATGEGLMFEPDPDWEGQDADVCPGIPRQLYTDRDLEGRGDEDE